MTDYFANKLVPLDPKTGAEMTPYVYGQAVATEEQDIESRDLSVKAGGEGGRYSEGTLHDAVTITLDGILRPDSFGAQDDLGAMRAAMDAFKAAHGPGPLRRLYLADDRFARVSCLSVKFDKSKGLTARGYTVTLVCPDDPPWRDLAVQTQPLATAGGTALTVGGNDSTKPQITLTFAAGGGLVTITDPTGAFSSLAPTQAGAYVLDSGAETVTGPDGSDQTGVWDGQFLKMDPGQFTLAVAATNGAQLSSASVSWQNRWR